ncbi:TetR/AcrR family transcriptional regulator [Actinomadura rupiterrae]|uniref:TetR/AcrR family transcriptional regulator n=1 Tax=Actinomadura rupiterrae TaxID=559627 RepID=UPI0020A291EE|nr:TetR/AcrR family transcriptional regulator [Actinomadura rupiterrae]MCP2336997.1 AcrR family transcriptional regulator [Actinomadura rupiterrae]
MTESLRERKKAATRRHLAEVATRLFVERGFEAVTIAEVAEAADVSVKTVYNYFGAKEDLVLPEGQASADRLAAFVRDRTPGESAARAVLRNLRAELSRRDRTVGLTLGYGRFMRMVRESPTLLARFDRVGTDMREALAAELAAATGASPDDLVTRLVAAQIAWVQERMFAEIADRTARDEPPGDIAAAMHDLLDVMESLLGDRVLDYATREPE